MTLLGGAQDTIMAIVGQIGYVALFIIIGAILFGIYYWRKEKESWDIDVGIHKRVGTGTIYLTDIAKQTRDSKGTVIFTSKKYKIELPAVDSRYFILSSLGAGRRYISFWEPMPNAFLPMDTDFIKLHDKKVVTKTEAECIYCRYARDCVEEKKSINFKSREFLDKYVSTSKNIEICNNHLSKVYTAKYKIMSEVEKEWMFTRAKERILRAVTDRPWYDKPVVAGAMIIIGALVFTLIIMKFGKEWFADAMEKAASSAADVFIQKTSNIPVAPPN